MYNDVVRVTCRLLKCNAGTILHTYFTTFIVVMIVFHITSVHDMKILLKEENVIELNVEHLKLIKKIVDRPLDYLQMILRQLTLY